MTSTDPVRDTVHSSSTIQNIQIDLDVLVCMLKNGIIATPVSLKEEIIKNIWPKIKKENNYKHQYIQ